MRLYYTVSSNSEDVQLKPNLSLGSYKSSTPVQSDTLNNLFSDISMYTVKVGNAKHYIGLVLKNESGANITNAKIYFEYGENCYSKLRLSAVNMAGSAPNQYMEQITTPQSKPIYADFAEANGVGNAVSIGNILRDGQIGIWIQRELMLDLIKSDQNNIYQVDPTNPYNYLPLELPKEDDINICISWD